MADCECGDTHYACTCVRKRMEALEQALVKAAELMRRKAQDLRYYQRKPTRRSVAGDLDMGARQARALLPERRAE